MAAKYILAALALAFGAATLWRHARDGFKLGPQSRTWLMVAVIFGAVATWLWWTEAGNRSMTWRQMP